MSLPLEDYALIGDLHTAALVGRNGSIDWLCFPRFDGVACFAKLLGDEHNGYFVIAPDDTSARVSRRYSPETLVLETEFETDTGVVRVIDFMPPRTRSPDLVRLVVGVAGRVPMRLTCAPRFDYGEVTPWIISAGRDVHKMVAGPHCLELRAPYPLELHDGALHATFDISAGQRSPFVLTWYPSHQNAPKPIEPEKELDHTIDFWTQWVKRCTYHGPYRDAVVRSLITLKAMTYQPTGGVVAAVTTSLPEQWQGPRNWDYRFCWLRDATFTLYALLTAGYEDEARAWRDWLLRAVAGEPSKLQIMYGLAGERRLTEETLDWLPGYEGAKPVRIGNAAHSQFQLDVFGEVMDMLHGAARAGVVPDHDEWALERELLCELETRWREPDDGIWEMRGGPRHFTHSKVMAWVAFDRGIKTAERFGLHAPLAEWHATRRTIHDDVCARAYNPHKQAFTQVYGGHELDASLLAMPHLGFLPATDPRVRSTVEAIARELTVDGFVLRYNTERVGDGLPPGEGTFLLCTFWLADDLALLGEYGQATELFERLLSLRNDLGLLSEQYDPRTRRLLGNFPQAFSHVALVNTAFNLSSIDGPARDRSKH
ncbi:MAG: glycoside hydrolase family 15 protein [Myxococcales bacterium]